MMKLAILAVGVGQLVLAVGSLTIPRTLGWREDTAKLKLLTRQVFWTYAGYIWMAHVAFGLVSTFAPGLLLDRTPLAALVCGFIALWWTARVVIQFTWFDRSARPPGATYVLAEVALVGLFIANTVIYWTAVWVNLK
jgi:hypothetical protein